MTKQRHDICCPAVSSVVRWSQSTEHMVQLVCGLLLSVVLLVSQQATEKCKIITNTEVKLSVKAVLKPMKSVPSLLYSRPLVWNIRQSLT